MHHSFIVTHWKPILETLKTVGVLIGGGWVLYTFLVQRRFAPMIEFTVEASVRAHDSQNHILECILVLTNKGFARQKLQTLRVSVRGIKSGAALGYWQRLGGQPTRKLDFPVVIATRESLFPKDWKFTFVDPGVTQRYTFVCPVAHGLSSLLVHGVFEYPTHWFEREPWPHTADLVIAGHPAATISDDGGTDSLWRRFVARWR